MSFDRAHQHPSKIHARAAFGGGADRRVLFMSGSGVPAHGDPTGDRKSEEELAAQRVKCSCGWRGRLDKLGVVGSGCPRCQGPRGALVLDEGGKA